MSAFYPPRQLPLPLPVATSHDPADLLEDESNRAALAWLRRPEDWPGGRLALFGPAATGKTHMLRGMAAERGWPVLEGPMLRGLPEVPPGPGLAVDDADCAAEERALLHLLNLCAERRQPVLLAGREAPARWPVALPDLRSRLRAMTAVAVQPPGDSLLAALLQKHFADRQLRVDPGLQAWLLSRLPREAAAVAEAAARLDRAALATGGRLTRALTRAALEGMPGFEEDAAAEPENGSIPAPRLL
ncbi:MAG: chromosomal replication initiator DnaA [Acetobacteraceae bacterium]|nr:chromosomal replication initiator DnaA [Acetobacteraceae bacterium]MDI3306145.1 chromosomal replication initiator DnaA [Acetobacteraceae bacterium]